MKNPFGEFNCREKAFLLTAFGALALIPVLDRAGYLPHMDQFGGTTVSATEEMSRYLASQARQDVITSFTPREQVGIMTVLMKMRTSYFSGRISAAEMDHDYKLILNQWVPACDHEKLHDFHVIDGQAGWQVRSAFYQHIVLKKLVGSKLGLSEESWLGASEETWCKRLGWFPDKLSVGIKDYAQRARPAFEAVSQYFKYDPETNIWNFTKGRRISYQEFNKASFATALDMLVANKLAEILGDPGRREAVPVGPYVFIPPDRTGMITVESFAEWNTSHKATLDAFSTVAEQYAKDRKDATSASSVWYQYLLHSGNNNSANAADAEEATIGGYITYLRKIGAPEGEINDLVAELADTQSDISQNLPSSWSIAYYWLGSAAAVGTWSYSISVGIGGAVGPAVAEGGAEAATAGGTTAGASVEAATGASVPEIASAAEAETGAAETALSAAVSNSARSAALNVIGSTLRMAYAPFLFNYGLAAGTAGIKAHFAQGPFWTNFSENLADNFDDATFNAFFMGGTMSVIPLVKVGIIGAVAEKSGSLEAGVKWGKAFDKGLALSFALSMAGPARTFGAKCIQDLGTINGGQYDHLTTDADANASRDFTSETYQTCLSAGLNMGMFLVSGLQLAQAGEEGLPGATHLSQTLERREALLVLGLNESGLTAEALKVAHTQVLGRAEGNPVLASQANWANQVLEGNLQGLTNNKLAANIDPAKGVTAKKDTTSSNAASGNQAGSVEASKGSGAAAPADGVDPGPAVQSQSSINRLPATVKSQVAAWLKDKTGMGRAFRQVLVEEKAKARARGLSDDQFDHILDDAETSCLLR